MIKMINLFLLICFLGFTNISSAQNMPEPDRIIHLNFSATYKKDPKYLFYFLKHLDRWYLQLTSDHKKFKLLNSQELTVGTQIVNEEVSKGQELKHLYTVIQFDQNAGVFQMESPISRVLIWKLFRMQNKTILTIKIKDNKDGTYAITSDVELIFASKADKDKALSFKADKIWQKHVNTEMTKALEIINLLDNI